MLCGERHLKSSDLCVVDKDVLADFVCYYLHHHLPYKVPEFHEELYSLVNEKKLVVAAPRGYAKSFIFSFFYSLFVALTQPKSDILIVSETYSFAVDWIRRIKDEIEHNQLLIADFGKLKSDKWAENDIILANGSRLRAKGQGEQIRGLHPTHAILDDIENDELVRSEDQREKLKDWFFKALLGTLTRDSQIIVIGTVLHHFSLLNELLKKEGWTRRKYKAINDDGTALWPEKYTLEELEAIKLDRGSVAFSTEYLNDPIMDGVALFKEKDIMFYDGDTPVGRDFITVDLAISEKDQADYTVIMVCRRTETNLIYVVDYIRKRINPNETVNEILRLARTYQPIKIGIESVAYQRSAIFALQEEMKYRDEYYQVEELKADRDKYRRICALVPYFENHRIYIHKDMKPLIEEITTYPISLHDDCLDALAYQLQINQPYFNLGSEQLSYYAQDRVSGY